MQRKRRESQPAARRHDHVTRLVQEAAYTQALKFGAHVIVARGATGAIYRKPELENLSKFEGAGVYHGATPMEAQLCVNDEVVVIGGGNAAGQAAVFLAQTS